MEHQHLITGSKCPETKYFLLKLKFSHGIPFNSQNKIDGGVSEESTLFLDILSL
jgi:hypothetical protein